MCQWDSFHMVKYCLHGDQRMRRACWSCVLRGRSLTTQRQLMPPCWRRLSILKSLSNYQITLRLVHIWPIIGPNCLYPIKSVQMEDLKWIAVWCIKNKVLLGLSELNFSESETEPDLESEPKLPSIPSSDSSPSTGSAGKVHHKISCSLLHSRKALEFIV